MDLGLLQKYASKHSRRLSVTSLGICLWIGLMDESIVFLPGVNDWSTNI
ncbi:hypothetical protein [Calothrix sp. NIES-3974]|nr:hypothetical protein [Calothrix sp. NIES-3974]BAZ06047.1 hypothetical protein NIES3974_27040 [Calothrix sp. NIES-3974]